MFWLMKPDTSGPSTGPMKGAAEKIIIGLQIVRTGRPASGVVCETHVPTFSLRKTSAMVPPDTERKAEPANPVQKRKIM